MQLLQLGINVGHKWDISLDQAHKLEAIQGV